jgi:hypothetical protein
VIHIGDPRAETELTNKNMPVKFKREVWVVGDGNLMVVNVFIVFKTRNSPRSGCRERKKEKF